MLGPGYMASTGNRERCGSCPALPCPALLQAILHQRGWELSYPLFTTVNRIIHGSLTPEYVCK
jgi:hypothetical protein